MKNNKLLSAALALLVSASSVSEARMTTVEAKLKAQGDKLWVDASDADRVNQITAKSSSDRLLGIDSQILDSLENGFSYYNNTQTPFLYEPNTGLLMTILRGGIEGDPTDNRNNGFIRYSDDLGKTWTEKIGPVQDPLESEQDSLRYPSLTIHSPEGATGISDLLIYHSYPFVQGGWGPYGVGVTFGDELLPITVAVPRYNINGIDYSWLPNTCLTVSPDGQTVLAFVPLDPPEDALPVDNNNLGLITYNFSVDDKPIASIPDHFATSLFTEPQDIGNTAAEEIRTNRMIQTGWDKAGGLYFGIIAQLRENGSGLWSVPMITKSSDEAKSWTGWDFMPESFLIDYLEKRGVANPAAADFGLTGRDMQILGENHIVIATLIREVSDRPEESHVNDLVEIVYRDGEWSILQIASHTGDILGFYNTPEELTANDQQFPQTYPDIQISPTADGLYLVAKWVDLVFYDFEGQTDPIATYDVFFAAREIGSTTWGPKVNVSNSRYNEKTTWIPRVIPSLSQVPFLSSQTNLGASDWYQNTAPNKDSLDNSIAQRLVYDKQHVLYATLDISTLVVSVDENGEQLPKAANVSVSPNPANATTNINFDLPNSGQTSISIYDLFGRKVATLFDGLLPAGQNSMEFNTSDQINGTYFVQIELDGISVSESFVVSR